MDAIRCAPCASSGRFFEWLHFISFQDRGLPLANCGEQFFFSKVFKVPSCDATNGKSELFTAAHHCAKKIAFDEESSERFFFGSICFED